METTGAEELKGVQILILVTLQLQIKVFTLTLSEFRLINNDFLAKTAKIKYH